ncbi:GNAT family N-acetyltransferase [Microbulbifer aggregans]|uniref:GNAT family N-acetyltransferase n=1 Tax=Microbulbifer aggregans TaxID=1769779 RepID=UPI001CFD9E07|nr:GNAT family N-acetyltransferase [Microbulbifer aggregans]
MSLFVRLADWNADHEAIRRIREQVFIEEQKVPADIEWDEHETSAQHFLIFLNDKPVGTGRITGDGKIGRMAVLAGARGHGAGLQLLKFICGFARAEGQKSVYLNAQCQAEPFYEKAGFAKEGDVFAEAGIPHVRMTKKLGEAAENA